MVSGKDLLGSCKTLLMEIGRDWAGVVFQVTEIIDVSRRSRPGPVARNPFPYLRRNEYPEPVSLAGQDS